MCGYGLVFEAHSSGKAIEFQQQNGLILERNDCFQQKDFFSKMVVDAVSMLDELLPLNMIGVKKVQGGSLEDSALVTCFHYLHQNVLLFIRFLLSGGRCCI